MPIMWVLVKCLISLGRSDRDGAPFLFQCISVDSEIDDTPYKCAERETDEKEGNCFIAGPHEPGPKASDEKSAGNSHHGAPLRVCHGGTANLFCSACLA